MEAENGDKRRPVVRPVSVIATGLTAAAAAFLTSRFGIAGTILGTAVMAMLITAGASILEIYLETAAAKARTVPSSLRVRGAPGNARSRVADTTHRGPRGLFARLASLPTARRRSVLAGTLVAAVLSFLITMGAVTAVELSVGKSLSCWLWDECPERSSGGQSSSEVETQPSVLGGQPVPSPAHGVDDAPYGQPTGRRPPVLSDLRNSSRGWARTPMVGPLFLKLRTKTRAGSRSKPGQAHRRGTWIGNEAHRSRRGNILGPSPTTARVFPTR
jgi:hypothetical protein